VPIRWNLPLAAALAEEVLERQDEQLRAFLPETSVLERLSTPLCDAVTGRQGSQGLLEQAERAGLVPLDEVRGWWRYHHLFAHLLRARLQLEHPGRAARLHRSAAAWYAGHGLADDAIGHAAAAGEMPWAARIIEQHFDAVYNTRGEAATIHRWLSVLPPTWSGPAMTTLRRGYLAQLRGDAEATTAFATQTLTEIKPGERLLSVAAHEFLAVAEWLRGRLTKAESAFASSITGWREAGQLTITAWGWYELALIQRAQGRLVAAAQTCEQALDSLVTSGRPCRPRDRALRPWPRSPTSGANSTSPCGTPPRASGCAASSSSPPRWPTAWLRWR